MIIELLDYEPPPRIDGTHWNRAKFYRGASSTGPWTAVTTAALSPTDTDPTSPRSRNFSFSDTEATSESWYQVTFLDAADVETLPSTPVAGTYRIQYLPSVQEIGSLARSRTKTDSGELGTFTSATRPTSAGVRDLIRQASNDVASAVGWKVPSRVNEIARSAVVLGTAMLIELSYFPEQVTTNRSPYQQYKDLYDQRLARIIEVVRETEDGGDPVAGYEGMPYFGGFDGQGTSMTEEW